MTMRKHKKRVRFSTQLSSSQVVNNNYDDDHDLDGSFDDTVIRGRDVGGDQGDDVDLDDDEEEVGRMGEVVGEEADGTEKYNERGEVIEPFNLRSERANDGYFDANGNFVWKHDNEEPDAWLAQMDESAVEAAIGDAVKRKLVAEADEEEDIDLETSTRVLAYSLHGSETVAAALRRLGKGFPETRTDFDRLTSLADALVRSGRVEAYEDNRESLLKDAPPDMRHWEYRAADGNVYGPFSTSQIIEWRDQGFFTGQGAVPMRQAAPPLESAAGTTTTTATTCSSGAKNQADEFLEDLDESTAECHANGPELPRWRSSDDIDFGRDPCFVFASTGSTSHEG